MAAPVVAPATQTVISVSPSELRKEIKRALRTKVNILVLGRPGIGKTEIPQEIARDLKIGFKRIVLPQFDEVDLRGIPDVNEKKRTVFYPTEELPYADKDKEVGILLMDELPSARQSVQIICHQLLDNRRMGSLYELPPGWIIVATGNEASDYCFVYELPPTVRTRCVVLHLESNFEQWKPWAMDNNISPEILSYLKNNPQDFINYTPENTVTNHALPRTWMLLSRYLNDCSEHSEAPTMAYVIGQVGEGVGTKFFGWRSIWQDVPDINAVLKGEVDTIPRATATQWCVVCALTTRLVSTPQKNPELRRYLQNAFAYINRFEADLLIAFLNDLMPTKFWHRNKEAILATPEWGKISLKNAKIIMGNMSREAETG